MMDPEQLHDHASHVILHAWIATYLSGREAGAPADFTTISTQFSVQAGKLRDSAILLQAALEKMRIANEKLALRMAEHKAFFAKYRTPE